MQISPTAVSMALRNSGGVSDALRNKVLKVAKELDYFPSLAGRLLRSKNTGQLGLYLPIGKVESLGNTNGFIVPVMTHFINKCEENEYSYHIEFGENFHTFKAPAQLTGRIVDGVLLIGEQNQQLSDWLNIHPEYKWVNIIEKAEYCVLSDNKYGVYRAIEHLAAIGHRKIAFVHCDLDYDAHVTALEGYHDAVKDFNLYADSYLATEIKSQEGNSFFEQVNQWTDFILQDAKRPSAIIFNDQKIASNFLIQAAYKGIRIPEQMSIIAYGVKSMAERIQPLMTSIEADFSTIMDKGINMLKKRIKKQNILEKQIMVKPKLVKRDSVAPPITQR